MVCIISLDKFIGSDGQPRLLPNRLLFCINELETYSAPCITIALSLVAINAFSKPSNRVIFRVFRCIFRL
jgi:hypothetical protein